MILAFDIYVHRLAPETAGMAAAWEGSMPSSSRGGWGGPEIRWTTVKRLGFLGLDVEESRNTYTGEDAVGRQADGMATSTLRIGLREELEIARRSRRPLALGSKPRGTKGVYLATSLGTP